MNIKDFLTKTCLFLNIQEDAVDIEVDDDNARLRINLNVPKEKESEFFKNDGEAILSLEYLLKLVFRKEIKEKRLICDVNNYRKQNEAILIKEATQLAEKVLETGEDQVMRGLNSYERYVVHSALNQDVKFSQVTTFSRDEGYGRCLIISLQKK
jgi:spoIIIJ-associated protein